VYTDAALTTPLPSAAVTIDNAQEPARQVFVATPAFFTTLSVRAEVGRLEIANATLVAVISDRYWRARFAGDRGVIGRAIVVNGDTCRIAGVAAPGFLGVSLDSAGDIWLLQPQVRAIATFAVARLRPGVSIEQATAATAAPLDNADPTLPTLAATLGTIETSVIPGG